MENIRVRFAPSPTGEIHIGNVHTAIFDWLIARRHKGIFILRIEDTDKVRSTEESALGLMSNLKWLGLDWDEGPGSGGDFGPYFQSQKYDRYRSVVEKLLAEGKAYRCYCAPEELEEERKSAQAAGKAYVYSGKCRNLRPEDIPPERRENFVVRFNTPPEGKTVVDDVIRGRVEFDNALQGDFIITKSDGGPVFNLANVVDDMDMKVTHVIRGEDLLSSTPKQVLIYRALGAEPPVFAHMPLLMGPDGARLSKRHGATSLEFYRREGYMPDAMFNFLTLLSWNPGDDREIMTRDEIIEAFALEDIGKAKSIFDPEKLKWMNGKYIRMLEFDKYVELQIPFLIDAGFITREQAGERMQWLRELLGLFHDRVRTLAEIVPLTEYVFKDIEAYDEKPFAKFMMKDEKMAERIEAAAEMLRDVPWELEPLEQALNEFMEKNVLKPKQIFQPIRIAITGKSESPGLFETMKVIGRDKVIERLDAAADEIRQRREEGNTADPTAD